MAGSQTHRRHGGARGAALWTGIVLASLVAEGAPAAAVPDNPIVVGPRICISDEGVHCYERDGSGHSWSALVDGHTLELTHAAGLVLTAGSGGVTALDADSGRVVWSQRALGSAFSPIADGEALWLGTRGGDVARLDRDTGEPVWRTRLAAWIYTPARAGDRLVAGGRAPRLWGLDADSGAILWSRPLSQELVSRPVTLTDEAVLAATFDGRLRLVDARSGEDRWQRALGTPAVHLLTDTRRVFALLMGGRLVALDRDDGHLLWQRQLAGSPRQLGRRGQELLVWPGATRVVALDAATGAVRARAPVSAEIVGGVLADGRVAIRPPLQLVTLTFEQRSPTQGKREKR